MLYSLQESFLCFSLLSYYGFFPLGLQEQKEKREEKMDEIFVPSFISDNGCEVSVCELVQGVNFGAFHFWFLNPCHHFVLMYAEKS